VYQRSTSKLLKATGLVATGSEGHRLVQSQGAYIGGRNPLNRTAMNDSEITWIALKQWEPEEIRKFLIHGDLLLFRRSKHNIRIVQVVSDEDYVLSGEAYPGMSAAWKREVLRRIAAKDSITEDEQVAIKELLEEDAPWAKGLDAEEPNPSDPVQTRHTRIRHVNATKGGVAATNQTPSEQIESGSS
jgi:tyrosyl-tRNA synthetase